MKAEYISHMGDDLLVVNAARVSFDKESEWEVHDAEHGGLSTGDHKLINYLEKHGHWTPFSHPQITLRETVPIFVARQRFKHMVGFTYNEVSRRYVDDQPEFFDPVWRERPSASIKQGSAGEHSNQLDLRREYNYLTDSALQLYHWMIKTGVAPEQARMVLPQSMYTSYYVTGSLAAFARLYKQRAEKTAQIEIQELAEQIGDIIAPLYPSSWKALTE